MFKLSKLFRYLMAQHLMMYVDEPGAGGTAPAAPAAPALPETFSREYVTELRNENKGYRLKAQTLEAANKASEEALAKAAAEADEKVSAATQAANDRILRAELKAAAIKAGMIDLDGLKLADLSLVKLNDAGEVEGAEALMAALKESKAYLFQASGTTTQTQPAPPKNGAEKPDVRKMNKEEYAAHKKAMGIK